MRHFFVCLLFGVTPLAVFGQAPPRADVNAVRLTKYILGVADLDKSYAFYHALGFNPQSGAVALKKPNILPQPLLMLVDVPAGTKFRNLMLTVPGADFALEITEFSNLELHAGHPRLQDPGASVFALTVRDVAAAVAVAKKSGGTAVAGAAPGNTAPMVKDPDGYYLQFIQAAAAKSSPDLVAGAQFGFVVQDAETEARFYRERFGFEINPGGWRPAANGDTHSSSLVIPGTVLPWAFFDFKAADRKPYQLRIPDPGAAAVGLEVRDLDAAQAAVKAAGGTVITQGGSAQLGAGKVGFVRDPSGVLVELAQPASRK